MVICGFISVKYKHIKNVRAFEITIHLIIKQINYYSERAKNYFIIYKIKIDKYQDVMPKRHNNTTAF